MQGNGEFILKKNVVNCRSQDYEFYTIPFPFRALKKTQRSKYLYSQLSKLHPCFSDDCCFDSRLRFEKTKIIADVIVMQKYKLAEYKQNTGKIYIEERRKIPFFNEKKKKELYAVFAATLVLFVTGCCVLYLRHSKADEQQGIETEEPFLEQAVQAADKTGMQAPIVFLSAVEEAGGKILSFELNASGFSLKLNAQLRGIFPEQLEPVLINAGASRVSFSAVSFEKGMPLVNLSLEEKIKGSGIEQPGNEVSNETKAEFRKLLNHYGIQLQSETVNPYGINLSIPYKSSAEAIFSIKEILDFVYEQQLNYDSLAVLPQKDQIIMSFVFLSHPGPDCGARDFCLELKERAEVFFQNNTEKTGDLSAKSPSFTEAAAPAAEKVGQIIRKDGSLIEFYKTVDGKIIRREK